MARTRTMPLPWRRRKASTAAPGGNHRSPGWKAEQRNGRRSPDSIMGGHPVWCSGDTLPISGTQRPGDYQGVPPGTAEGEGRTAVTSSSDKGRSPERMLIKAAAANEAIDQDAEAWRKHPPIRGERLPGLSPGHQPCEGGVGRRIATIRGKRRQNLVGALVSMKRPSKIAGENG